MSTNADPFYLTTAICYPNGAPHIGHAYEAIATDVLARFFRLDGRDVFFLTGTDEHGQKMLRTARSEGIGVQALADRNSACFQRMAEEMGCSNDDYIRTSEPRHHRASEEIWRRMSAAGDIFKGRYTGWYSVRDEAYYAGEETSETADGTRLGPQGTPVEWVEEDSYFFRLSAFQDRLLAHYEAHPDFIGPPGRRNEVIAFVRGGLDDLSISRTSFDWGVKVPGAPGHVMYVWVDALTNYLTGAGFPDCGHERWRFWPADLHVIGKDILRFHAIYWPAFLMSAGLDLPRRIYSHGFLLNQGEKMSKSTGNVVSPSDMAARYGRDALRYFLLREVPFGRDGSYSHEAIVQRINADLANDLGNLAQRSLTMIARNCDGKMPRPGPLCAADEKILARAAALLPSCRTAMEVQAIHQVLFEIWQVIGDTNRYFAGEEPWKLRKSDPERMATVLYVCADLIRHVAILALPVMPDSCARLLELLALDPARSDFASLGTHTVLQPGTKLPPPKPLFPRYQDSETGHTPA